MILDALRRGPLTPMDALHRFGCFRLAARVRDLREQGHAIAAEQVVGADGKRYARYSIGGQA